MSMKSIVTTLAITLTASAALIASGSAAPKATISGSAAPKVTLTGKAQDCHPGKPIRLVGIYGVSVSAFQVSKVPVLMSNLKTMDTTTITGEASMIRLDSLSRQTYRLVNSSTALLRATSDSTGTFKLSIPVTDSVVVYGTADDTDQPNYQAFKTMSGRVSGSFMLDMSHGGCNP